MHHHHARLLAGQHVAEARPDVAPLAARAGAQLRLLELLEQRGHARAVVPEQHRPLRQLAEELPGLDVVARAGRAVNAHDNLLDVGDGLEFAHDQLQGARAEFLDVAGQHQGHRRFLREFLQLLFEPRDAGPSQPVQGGDGASLKEVRHECLLSKSPPRTAVAEASVQQRNCVLRMAARPSQFTSGVATAPDPLAASCTSAEASSVVYYPASPSVKCRAHQILGPSPTRAICMPATCTSGDT